VSGPSKASITFARGVFAQMFERDGTPADAEQLVVLAIAFDATARASREAVAAEREACAKIADKGIGNNNMCIAEAIALAIRARGAK
jgi:hypothetical protein